MRCIACNSDYIPFVSDTKSDDGQVWRRYECENCGLRSVVYFRADPKTLKRMLLKSKKIAVVRLIRMATGKGYIESKAAADQLAVEAMYELLHKKDEVDIA